MRHVRVHHTGFRRDTVHRRVDEHGGRLDFRRPAIRLPLASMATMSSSPTSAHINPCGLIR
jgi:hypothetical protein